MYTELLPENFDENNSEVLNEIKIRYSQSVKKSIEELNVIKKLNDKLETQLIKIIDFDMLAKIYNKVLKNI